MNKMVNALFNICYLEELARRDEWINRIHPLIKLMITLLYIIGVASVGKYEVIRVLLFGLYPILVITITGLPLKPLLQKMMIPALAGASLGILNPYLDPLKVILTSNIAVSAGWISLLTLFLKSMFSILAALILVATTKVEAIAGALNLLKLPRIMTIQFLLMFRYITVLVHEVDRTITAYSLRAGGKRAIGYKAWGSMLGQLFMRTSNRSIELYEAMKLRGFKGEVLYATKDKVSVTDGVYFIFWMTLIGLLTVVKL